eukprot:XP_014780931.1 PREDICTED: uncharacterized protein LOC106876757 [Octopus bimaculoides]
MEFVLELFCLNIYISSIILQLITAIDMKGYCWRITFNISSNYFSGTSNYFTVQLNNDETQVFSNKLSCSDKCESGTQPSFDFSTSQIDPVKELQLNETVKNLFKRLTSGWTLITIGLMNLNTSANYRCTLDKPDADEKGCKLKFKGYAKEPIILTTAYDSSPIIITITTADEQTDSEENTSASLFDYDTTPGTDARTKTNTNTTSTKTQTTTSMSLFYNIFKNIILKTKQPSISILFLFDYR